MTRVGRQRHEREASRDRGQSLVEFAPIFLIIILLIAGFFEIGRAVFAYNMIANAARRGRGSRPSTSSRTSPSATRLADRRPVPAALVDPLRDPRAKTIGISTSNVSVSYAAPPDTTLTCSPTLHVGCIASVTVTYAFTVATPFVNKLIGPITMSQTATMTVERVFP